MDGTLVDPSREHSMTAKHSAPNSSTASKTISSRLDDLGDWRGETLALVRAMIHEADPDILEEFKWAKATTPGVPVWSHDGIVCTGETYKAVVKLTFARGAFIADPTQLFNSSLEGGTRRAIDIREGETLNAAAFRKLIQAAVAENGDVVAKRALAKKSAKKT